jgi:hypothetical protein
VDLQKSDILQRTECGVELKLALILLFNSLLYNVKMISFYASGAAVIRKGRIRRTPNK